MDLNLVPSTPWLLLAVVSLHGIVGVASLRSLVDDEHTSFQASVLKRMGNIQSHLANVTESLGELDHELAKAMSNCFGLPLKACQTLELELETRVPSRQPMSSLLSTVKRSQPADPQAEMYSSLYNDVRRKRALVKRLTTMFQGAHKILGKERKRSCRVNLGFYCQTEEIVDFSDLYNYLQSPMSPGRKRSVNRRK